MSAAAADVPAVMVASEAVISGRLAKLRRKFDDLMGRGKEPHPELLVTLDRAEYLRDSVRIASAVVGDLMTALKLAEAALSDIGDADREPGDDVAWCERRAAEPLPVVRSAIARCRGAK